MACAGFKKPGRSVLLLLCSAQFRMPRYDIIFCCSQLVVFNPPGEMLQRSFFCCAACLLAKHFELTGCFPPTISLERAGLYTLKVALQCNLACIRCVCAVLCCVVLCCVVLCCASLPPHSIPFPLLSLPWSLHISPSPPPFCPVLRCVHWVPQLSICYVRSYKETLRLSVMILH